MTTQVGMVGPHLLPGSDWVGGLRSMPRPSSIPRQHSKLHKRRQSVGRGAAGGAEIVRVGYGGKTTREAQDGLFSQLSHHLVSRLTASNSRRYCPERRCTEYTKCSSKRPTRIATAQVLQLLTLERKTARSMAAFASSSRRLNTDDVKTLRNLFLFR